MTDLIPLRDAATERGCSTTMLRRAWRDGVLELVQAGRGLAIERAELERVKRERRCKEPGCDTVTLGKSGYCEPHRGKANRGKSIVEGTRKPTRHYRTTDAERERRAEAVREANRRRWQDPDRREVTIERRQATRRGAIDRVKAETDRVVLETAEVVDRLKREQRLLLGRSPTTVTQHVQDGLLEPADLDLPPLPGRPPLLYAESAFVEYVDRLVTYPDARLRRFDEQPRFRAQWDHCAHGSTVAFGRLNAALATSGRKRGPKVKISSEQEARIRELLDEGRSENEIARRVRVSRKQVRRVKNLALNPPSSRP
jgi:Helix-turn-helix domain of resolvase